MREFFTSNTIGVFIDTVFVFIFLAVIFAIGGWLVLIPCIAFAASILLGFVVQQRIGKRVAASMNEAAQRQALLVESISTVETIKSLQAEAFLLRKWREHSKNASYTSERIKQLSASAANVTLFIQQLVTVAIVVAGAYAYELGNVSTGAIVACVMLSSRAVAPLGQVAMTIARLRQAIMSLRILNSIMSQPEDVPDTVGFVNRAIRVSGSDLVLEQVDGSLTVIKNGAVNIPTIMLGDVEVPRVALVAALAANDFDIAVGPDGTLYVERAQETKSSGGDFHEPPGSIGDPFDLSALLPPTALAFPQFERREIQEPIPEIAGGSEPPPANSLDDTPIAVAGISTGIVDDEGLAGGIADGIGDVAGADTVAIGSVTGLFLSGADTPLSYGFNTGGGALLPALTSGGVPLTYTIAANLITAMAGGQTVFTMALDAATGAWTFTLSGPLDHPTREPTRTTSPSTSAAWFRRPTPTATQ